MDRILIILKKENDPRASSAPALGLNTIIFKHVYWYMQQTQVSVYRTIGPLVNSLQNLSLNSAFFVAYSHLSYSLASFLWDMSKEYRCDNVGCGFTSGAVLFAQRIFIKE